MFIKNTFFCLFCSVIKRLRMLQARELDRHSLLAALEGRLSTIEGNQPIDRVPVSCQSYSLEDENMMTRLKVEGLGKMEIPVPYTVSALITYINSYVLKILFFQCWILYNCFSIKKATSFYLHVET